MALIASWPVYRWKWMGHASIETAIRHYGHLVKSFLKEEVKKLEGRMDTWLKSRTEEACKSLEIWYPLQELNLRHQV